MTVSVEFGGDVGENEQGASQYEPAVGDTVGFAPPPDGTKADGTS